MTSKSTSDHPETGGSVPPGKQGAAWSGEDLAELRAVLEAAFDYRGNVTLQLCDGSEVTGYLSNRDFEGAEPFVHVFPADGGARRELSLGEIRGVVFSGRDTAEGKSWQTWLKAYQAKKEAERRGEQVESIDLFPEPLD